MDTSIRSTFSMSSASSDYAHELPYARIPGSEPVPRPLKWSIHKCSSTNMSTIGLEHSDGRVYFFEFCAENDTILPHVCSCQPDVTEKDLFPDYAVWCEEIEDHVIFAFNSMSNKMEQFVYSFETHSFVEIERPELVYNRGNSTLGSIVTALSGEKETIVIERDENGAMKSRSSVHGDNSQTPVDTLVMQSIEKNELAVNKDEEVTNISNEFGCLDYLESLPELRIQRCSKLCGDIVQVVSKTTGSYSTYNYTIYTGKFNNTNKVYCTSCNSVTSEKHLKPQYSVHSEALDARVIHCRNSLTNDIEQYTYNPDTNAFEQVYCKELAYDPSRISNATNDYEAIQKEKYSSITDEYVVLPAAPVKTFAVRIQEEKQKKLDEEEQQKVLKIQELEKQKDEQIMKSMLELEDMKKLLEEKDEKILMHVGKQRVMKFDMDILKNKLDESIMKIKEANDHNLELEKAKLIAFEASREEKKQYDILKNTLKEKEDLIEKLKAQIAAKDQNRQRTQNFNAHSNPMFGVQPPAMIAANPYACPYIVQVDQPQLHCWSSK
ncbi:SKICH domain-containing protein [Caenorhabditis elegans]|uniref:SKICH domain-containing protein n=1 Tax=Caenorhabditis elegans TaxID=6239 RepID=O02263_CAEEL|nr:SKICH domain-containing protein [Caenorhabditis elegans]CAB03104.2 SKICH domain-containing protein [Caenorhabditis elegans]|eukprot:NP_493331.2 Uncharacterized protein CELE_F44F1.4 [Caenorhabditis elegans]